ncbi:hypothetical protein JYT44_00835 [Caldithrix abyssi]|nr:hypothetical protein [Caldithrix abyssi]
MSNKIMNIILILIDVFKNYWTSIIATLAFLIAFLTLYYTHWQGFKPKIYSAGRYELSRSDVNLENLALTLVLNFSNLGAKTGVIENIYVKFYISEKEKVLLTPRYDIQSRELNITREQKPLTAITFSAFPINPKETITKKIMFIPWSISKFSLLEGTYYTEIFVKTSISRKWEMHDTIRIKIDKKDIDVIFNNINVPEGGGIVNFYFRNKMTTDRKEEFDKINKSINNSN